jgi:hypothetical protein
MKSRNKKYIIIALLYFIVIIVMFSIEKLSIVNIFLFLLVFIQGVLTYYGEYSECKKKEIENSKFDKFLKT